MPNFIFFCIAYALFSPSTSAQPETSSTKPCFICDSETAIFTNEDDFIPNPEDFGRARVSCKTLSSNGMEGLLSEDECRLAQKSKKLHDFCGCDEPGVVEESITILSAYPSSSPTPVLRTLSANPSKSPTTNPLAGLTSQSPSGAATSGTEEPTIASSLNPSDSPSDTPSDSPSSTPSKSSNEEGVTGISGGLSNTVSATTLNVISPSLAVALPALVFVW